MGLSLPAFADRYYSPQTSNSIGSGGSYCQGVSASAINFVYNTCVSGSGGTAYGNSMTVYWYQNSVNSTSGGSLVSTTSVTSATAATGTVSYTPPTTTAGTYYYYCIISYTASGTCGTGGTVTSPSAVQVVVYAAPGAITGTTTVAPAEVVTLGNTAAGGTWSSSNTAIASVNSSTGALRGVANGTATISYTTGCGSAVAATAYVIGSKTWYQDNDADGWGNPLVSATAAAKPSGYVPNKQDANDINVNASSWNYIGSAAFAYNGGSVNTTNNQIAYDNNGTPYVYFLLNSSASYVMKYTGSAWSFVGSSFTGNVPYASMAINSANVPYVAYQDGYNASCKKFDGSSWVQVGSANFTANGATYESLAFDNADVPYMAYRDNNVSNKASVMKFNGTSWVQVGSAGFSAGGASYTSIATDLNNNIYVAYTDEANSSKVSVMKYNGTSWSVVGSVGFSAGSSSYVSIAIDRTGTPYVAYKDGGNSSKATVMKYNGSSWVTVGTAGFSAGTANYTSLKLDAGGTPYVSYSDASLSNKAIVMKFNGTSWGTVVTSTGITPGAASYLSMALNQEGIPAIFYQDGSSSNKGSAMYLAPIKLMPTQPTITATPSLSCSGTTVTLTVASGTLNDATAWVWYKGSCGGTYVGTGTTITETVTSTTNYYCRGENNYFTTQGDCGYVKVTIKPMPTWYQDSDGDGWGNASVSVSQCTQPTGYVLNSSDCTDGSTTNTVAANFGNAGFSPSGAIYTNILFDANNIPYVYFNNNTSNTMVYKYNTSGTWSQYGSNVSSNSNYGTMAINSAGSIYVAYQDGSQASCKRHNGTDWEQVGTTNFTPGTATYTSLAIDNADVPYVGFVDGHYLANGKASVMKYNGVSWVNVGSQGFTAGTTNYTSLVIDGAGSLYLAFQDNANSNKATVMKYTAGAWSILGSAGFSDGIATYTSIAVDDNGTPYVVYNDATYSKACVKKYTGTTWVSVGASSGISSSTATYTSIKIDAGGNPYVSYTDNGLSSKASIMKFNGTSWVSVSTASGFTPNTSSHSSLALDANGIPYLSTRDAANSNKITVYKAAPTAVNPTTPTVATSATSITCGTSITLSATGTLNNATAWRWYTDTIGSVSIGSGAVFTVTPTTSGVRYYARGEGSCLTNQGYFGIGSAVTVSGGVAIPSDITGTSPICRNATTTFSSTAGGAWTTSSAAIASVNSSTGVVTGVSAGTATITYTLTNACGSNSKTKSITVVRPPSVITGTSTMCVSGFSSLSDSVSGGTWSSSNTGIANVGSSSGVVNGVAAGTATISYALTNTCGTTTVSMPVTVNAAPTVGGISATPTTYCMGAGGAITLTATGGVTGTGTLTSYNWSGPLGYSTTSATSSVFFTPTTSLSSGNYQLTVTYPGSGCTSSAVSSSYVTISPNPTIFSVTGGTGCTYPGVSVGLSGSQSGISYQLYIGGVASGSPVPGTGSALSFGLKTVAGVYTIKAIGAASCIADMSGSATVITAPAMYTVNGGTACSSTGVTISLSSSESGISYQLYRDAATLGSPVSGTGSSLSFGFQNTVGSYYIVATGTGGCADTQVGRANVVSSIPTYTVTGGIGCTHSLGTTIGLSGSQSGVTYQLYNGAYIAGSPVTGTGSAINFGLQTTAGTYTVSASTTGCTNQAMSGSATVYTSPSAYNVMGGSGCTSPGITVTLSGSASGVNYQLYRGTTPVGSAVAGTGASLSFGNQTTAGTYTIVGTAATGCAVTMNDSVVLSTGGTPPAAITGTFSLCPAGTTTLANTTAGGTWSSGATSVATITATGMVTAVAAGTAVITYATTASCGVQYSVATVTVNPVPVIVTPGTVTLCTGNSATLSVTGATTYAWSPATNLSATTGASVVANPTTSRTYTVTGSALGCSGTGTVTVTVNAVPTIASVSAGSSTLCYGSVLTLTAGAVAGAGTPTYNWSGPNGYSSTTSANISSLTVNTTAATGVYTASVTYPGIGCTSSNVVTSAVTVNALPAVSAITASSSALCYGSVLTLTAGTATGTGTLTSYNWRGPNSYSTSGTANVASVTVNTTSASGFYSVSVTYPGTGCTSNFAVITPSVTVSALPTVASVSASTPACVGSSLTLTAGSTTGAGTIVSYNWSGPNSYSATTTTSPLVFSPTTTAAAGVYTLSVTYPGTGCRSANVVTSSVTVNAAPISGTISGSALLQAGLTSTLTVAGASGGTGVWSSSNTSVVTVTTGSATTTLSGVSAGSASISYTVTNSCGATAVSAYTVNVVAQPVITSLSAYAGEPGSSIIITGSNFNATPASNTVYFGAVKAVVNAGSATTLSVTVPVGATFQSVSVLNTSNGLSAQSITPFLPVYDSTGYLTDSLNFKAPVTFVSTSAAAKPYTGAIGDIDGDGRPDMVVNNRDSNTLSIFLNNGSASRRVDASMFTLYSRLTTLGSPNNVKLADIDGDGKLDIVTAMAASTSMCVFRNTTSVAGAPSFATRNDISVGNISSVAAVADFNSDGKPDVALTLPAGSAIGVLRNTSVSGSISFAAVVNVSVGTVPSGVAIADLDGDGKPDIAAANSGFTGSAYTGNTVSVARNTSTVSTISFGSSVSLSSGSGPIDIATGDIDGDSKLDLLVTNVNDNNFSVIRNTASSGSLTSGSFAARVNFTAGTLPTGIAVADFNGDKKADVVVSNIGGSVSVFRNTTSGTTPSFAARTDINNSNGPTTVTVADLDGDKYSDIIVGNQLANTVSVIENYPLPRVAAITGASSVCLSSSIIVNNATAGGFWTSSQGKTTVNSTGLVTGVAPGADTINYGYILNYDTNYSRKPFVVNALPSIVLGTSPTVCTDAGTALLSYTGATGSPTAYSITWDAGAGSAGFTNIAAAAITAPFSFAVPAGLSGTYTGSVTVNNVCQSLAYPFSVNIVTYPSASITSAPAPCTGYATTLTITGTSGANVTYSVDGGSALPATLTSGSFAFSTGSISEAHTYTLLNAANAACTTAVNMPITITPVIMQWAGGVAGHETDWNYAGNWGCGIVPTVSDDAIIPSGTTYAPLLSSAGYSKDLLLQPGASLGIASGVELHAKGTVHNSGTVSGDGSLVMDGTSGQLLRGNGRINNLEVKNANGVYVETGALVTIGKTLSISSGVLNTADSVVLYSDVTGTARIAPLPVGVSINGKVQQMQYIQGGYRRFRFWSHPFSDTVSLAQVQTYIDITGAGGSANGFTTTSTNAASAFRFDPRTGNSSLGYDPGWKPFTRISATAADSNKLHPGQGIRLFFRGNKGQGLGLGTYVPAATTVKMSGRVNQGNFTVTLAKGATLPDYQDFNMVGNPYPSPVDIGTILYNAKQAGQITGSAFYVWTPAVGVGGQYITVAIGEGAPTPYYLQANAAFQVRAHHNGATLNFTEANKSAQVDNYLFKPAGHGVDLGIYDEQDHLWDQLNVRFSDNATAGEDEKDAVKLLGADLVCYTSAANGRKLAIDARPYNAEEAIPVGISSVYQQTFVIKAGDVSTPDGSAVYLHDKLLNTYTALSNGAEYAFSIGRDEHTQGQRFELSMKAAATVKALSASVTPNPATDNAVISFSAGSLDNVTVSITDMSGVNVYSKTVAAAFAGVITAPLNKLAAGIYIVEIQQGDQRVTRKLVKE